MLHCLALVDIFYKGYNNLSGDLLIVQMVLLKSKLNKQIQKEIESLRGSAPDGLAAMFPVGTMGFLSGLELQHGRL